MDDDTLHVDTKNALTKRSRLCENAKDKFKILALISVWQEIITLMLFVIERHYLAFII